MSAPETGSEPACKVCGCTESTPCIDDLRGACWWVADHLCSHCSQPDARRGAAFVAAAQLAEVVAELLLFAREGDLESQSAFALEPAEHTAEALRTILRIELLPGGFGGRVDHLPDPEREQLAAACGRFIEGWA